MKTSTKRTAGVFLVLCLTIIIADSIAWTDVMFWKTGVISIVFGLPSKILLWPLSLVSIKPGSAIDGPYFWLPLVCLLLLAWAWTIQHFTHKVKA